VICGKVAEWLKAPLSKSGNGKPFASSNLALSARTNVFNRGGLGEGDSNPTLSDTQQYRRFLNTTCGEMSELAEGARLEIVCAAYHGTEGSNPSLSAILLPPC
jgi:hypothetical protein